MGVLFDKLRGKQQVFVREYLISLNASDAYRKAGYSPKNADVCASQLLVNPRIASAVAEMMVERAAKLEIEAADVLKRLWVDATLDRTELTNYHVGSCRYCWGENHYHQWKSEREYAAAVDDWRKKPEAYREAHPSERPDDDGGYGYKLSRPHNPDCPECDGLGKPYIRFTDTSLLSPEARQVFAGVKETKEGIQYVMTDRSRALELVGKHLGMFKDVTEVSGKNGAPIEHEVQYVIVPAKIPAPSVTRPLVEEDDEGIDP